MIEHAAMYSEREIWESIGEQVRATATGAMVPVELAASDRVHNPNTAPVGTPTARGGAPVVRPASPKQVALITKLISERDTGRFAEDTLADLETFQATGTLPLRYASDLISALFSAPRKPRPGAVTTEGTYLRDGVMHRVQRAGHGGLYAKVWNGSGWTYDRGAIRGLTPEHAVTLEEARAFGIETVNCCMCGRDLENEESKQLGIGPVCRRKYF